MVLYLYPVWIIVFLTSLLSKGYERSSDLMKTICSTYFIKKVLSLLQLIKDKRHEWRIGESGSSVWTWSKYFRLLQFHIFTVPDHDIITIHKIILEDDHSSQGKYFCSSSDNWHHRNKKKRFCKVLRTFGKSWDFSLRNVDASITKMDPKPKNRMILLLKCHRPRNKRGSSSVLRRTLFCNIVGHEKCWKSPLSPF